MSTEAELDGYLAKRAQGNIDTGRHKSFSSAETAAEHAEETNFLGRVKDDLRIRSIYYPGCSQDTTLEPAFQHRQITFLDKAVLRRDAPNAFKGDFTDPPEEIEDGSFDAVFVKDLHLHEQK